MLKIKCQLMNFEIHVGLHINLNLLLLSKRSVLGKGHLWEATVSTFSTGLIKIH